MTSLLTAAFRRKKVTSPDSSHRSIEKTLTLFDLTLLGVGGTLGSGLFLLTGRAARYVAGPAITISFIIAAVACLFSALSYAEMASRFPNNGGAYSFTYAALGELPAFLVGMCLTLEYGVSSAAVARSWASYLGDSLPFLPKWMIGRDTMWCVLAFCLILSVSGLLAMGMREAKWVINVATLLYAFVVLVIVSFGSQQVNSDNWTPFMPFGVAGTIAGASAVFYSYVGFDEVACVAEETYDAATTVPLAILLSLFAVTCMYIVASLVLTGMVNYKEIDVGAPFSAAFRNVGLPNLARVVGFGTALGMMNTTLVALAAQPRIFYAMGRDGLLPRSFALSTRITTIGCGVVVSLLALVFDTKSLADVVSGGTLFAFLATNVSVLLVRCRIHSRSRRVPYLISLFLVGSALTAIINRLVTEKKFPHTLGIGISIPVVLVPTVLLFTGQFGGGATVERTTPSFLCPLVPLFPLAGAFTTTFLLFQLSTRALTAFLTWLTVSAAIYCLYGARNAVIANEYFSLEDTSQNGSYNSFETMAMGENSISSDTKREDPPSPQRTQGMTTLVESSPSS